MNVFVCQIPNSKNYINVELEKNVINEIIRSEGEMRTCMQCYISYDAFIHLTNWTLNQEMVAKGFILNDNERHILKGCRPISVILNEHYMVYEETKYKQIESKSIHVSKYDISGISGYPFVFNNYKVEIVMIWKQRFLERIFKNKEDNNPDNIIGKEIEEQKLDEIYLSDSLSIDKRRCIKCKNEMFGIGTKEEHICFKCIEKFKKMIGE